jgi:hypothetical protein
MDLLLKDGYALVRILSKNNFQQKVTTFVLLNFSQSDKLTLYPQKVYQGQ